MTCAVNRETRSPVKTKEMKKARVGSRACPVATPVPLRKFCDLRWALAALGGERLCSCCEHRRMALLVPLLVSTVTGLVTVSPTGRPTLRRPCNVQPCRHSQLRAIAGSKVRVRLRRPLGIMFEETNPGKAEGVVVSDLVEDGNAWKDGRVFVGDRLAKVSAVILGGESALVTVGGGKQYTNWERELVPCTKMDFDSIMAAIGLPSASNQG